MLENQTVRKSVVAVLAVLGLFLLAKTIGEFQSYKYIGSYPSSLSQISVSGKGEVVGIPDVATFSFSVTEESLVVKTAQDEAAKTMNAVIDYLKKNGVGEKDITTSGYNIYPRYEQTRDPQCFGPKSDSFVHSSECSGPSFIGKRTLAAYVVSQTVTVKVRKLEDAGKLLAGIGEIGATNISGLSFDFDKRDELVKEARDKAIEEAREEAAKLAKSLGVRLVRIVSYSDNGNYQPMYKRAYDMEMQAANVSNGSAPSIPVGEDKIISNVTIVYEVK